MTPRSLAVPWLAHAALLVALLVAMLGACVGSEATCAAPLGRPSLGPRGDAAYEVLLRTRRFTDGAIGDGGGTPIEVIALRHLWQERRAAWAFEALLSEAEVGGQLFALCGLYYSDPVAFRRAVEPFRTDTRTVLFQSGCTGLPDMPVRELVESSRPLVVRLERPDQTIREWLAARAADGGYAYDLVGGGYPDLFRSAGGYAEVAEQSLEEGLR